MHWTSILIGIILGWIIGWLIDFFFTRKKRQDWENAEADLRIQLANSLAENNALRAQIAAQQEVESEAEELVEAASRAPTAAGLVAAGLAAEEVVLTRDDLTIIEGIGDRTAELLNQHGIYAFAELAETDVERLRAILAEGGPGFRMAAPDTWPRQARLAANRDWVRLQTLKEELTGGVRKPAEAEPVVDDLTIIEGIGDRTAELLNQHGIYAFAELAETDVERLRAILAEGGPGFRMAAPDTWPRQARLAANRDWVRLQTLKEELTGGVRRPSEPEAPAEAFAEPPPVAEEEFEAEVEVEDLAAEAWAEEEAWPEQMPEFETEPAAEEEFEAGAEDLAAEALAEEEAWPEQMPEVDAEPPPVAEEEFEAEVEDLAAEAWAEDEAWPEQMPEVSSEPPLAEEEKRPPGEFGV